MQSSAVVVRGLHKTHQPRGSKAAPITANDAIDLDVGGGEVFGLLGPNGAGKSTLVRQVMGLLQPDRGQISVFGHDVVAEPSAAPRLAAYLAQDETALREMPVRLAVTTTARMRGLAPSKAAVATDDVIDELGLGPVADRPLLRLSGGQRRLACVAASLVGDRRLLVLDEPTAGLDPVARRGVWAALARRRDQLGTTVILVTHNVIEAETVLDRVAVLDRARVIACDTPGRLKAAVSEDVRLELVWRGSAPVSDPVVERLAPRALVDGRRWSLRLPQSQARSAMNALLDGPVFAALDDFTLATPTLEDVYLALGGRDDDLERA
ncbi:MAG TPA: ABC transporter ATP-binding protein [Acidothermaceae bacterium]|nr:ABC transporter ATP-binding protein [Acidothermaceae bacterium]